VSAVKKTEEEEQGWKPLIWLNWSHAIFEICSMIKGPKIEEPQNSRSITAPVTSLKTCSIFMAQQFQDSEKKNTKGTSRR
jgi:hypothetical protein